MSLIKNTAVRDHLSARRRQIVFPFAPVSQSEADGCPGDEPRQARMSNAHLWQFRKLALHIDELRDTIHRLHGAKASHVHSVPVKEVFQANTIWDGMVEVFELIGHPKADRIYAGIHDTDEPDKPKRHVTVLHLPPVVSAQTAVKAAIVQEYKERASAN